MHVSERGQVTIPKRLRDKFGFHHNVEIEFEPNPSGLLIRKCDSVEHPVDRVRGILDGIEGVAGKIENIDQYIEEIRGR